MKVAVVGAGAIGGYLGARLAAAGEEVTFIARGPNLAAIRTMLGAYGYQVERLSDWAGLLRDNPATDDFGDYAGQKRITLRCVNTKPAPA